MMGQREQDEADLTKLLKGAYVEITNVNQSIFHGTCHQVALWDGMVILHVVNRRFEFELEQLPDHVKILTNARTTPDRTDR